MLGALIPTFQDPSCQEDMLASCRIGHPPLPALSPRDGTKRNQLSNGLALGDIFLACVRPISLSPGPAFFQQLLPWNQGAAACPRLWNSHRAHSPLDRRSASRNALPSPATIPRTLSLNHTQYILQLYWPLPQQCPPPVLCLQVIVMSGHETIRVLEVGVDAQLPAEEESKGLEGVAAEGSQSGDPAEASQAAGKAGPDNLGSSAEATGTRPSPPPGTAPPEC